VFCRAFRSGSGAWRAWAITPTGVDLASGSGPAAGSAGVLAHAPSRVTASTPIVRGEPSSAIEGIVTDDDSSVARGRRRARGGLSRLAQLNRYSPAAAAASTTTTATHNQPPLRSESSG